MKGIEENFGVALDLSTEGRAVVFSDNAQSVARAVKLVRELVHEIEEVCALLCFVCFHYRIDVAKPPEKTSLSAIQQTAWAVG